ncbi:aldehyde dehydrogenase family protein [Teredinibacter waterburyi]|uniref:aldehyde dehydrogenase family protein n=1 Tax=Teredinibacter waterburyi TaxID=1500538 RepID=UPI00165EF6AE|nr:aldehyde dehydrogenase family protein [Teredinibacter waterburyi]
MNEPYLSEISNKFDIQTSAYLDNKYPSFESRIDSLNKLRRLLLDNMAHIEQAISKDFGYRSPHETRLFEFFPCMEAINFSIRNLKRWMKPVRRSTSIWLMPGAAFLQHQPLGVVGIIVPWNYPLYLLVSPLVSAIAAGNRVMLKLSEHSPNFSTLITNLLQDQFPVDKVCVVTGGQKVAEYFVQLPFQHLFFTGSTKVGRSVMSAASQNLTPVTLELGGKSPVLVDVDYSIEKAVRSIVWGKLVNAGQACIAPDYVLIPKGHSKLFIKKAISYSEILYKNADTDFTSIVSEEHYKRLNSMLDDAKQKGAHIHVAEKMRVLKGRYMALHLLTNVNNTMDIMGEELFGPIIPVIEYSDIDEAVAYINTRDKPLALYIFSNDRSTINGILKQTHSGGVTVNDTLVHMPIESLPFGGVGGSGMGRCHGEFGFKTFSNQRSIFKQARFNLSSLVHPPYNRLTRLILKLMLR